MPVAASSPNSRTDRRRALTRQRLLAAGRRLIAEKGVAGLRIQDITEEADVALGSFYNYFATKEELVEAVVAESLTELVSATVAGDEASQRDPAATVASAIRRVIRLAFDDPDFARLVVNLARADTLFLQAFHPYARDVVERGVRSARFDVPDVEVTVTVVVGGSLALIRAILDGQHTDGAEIDHAELALRCLGLSLAEARVISRLPLS